MPAVILDAVMTYVACCKMTINFKSYQTLGVPLIMLNKCMMSGISRQAVSPPSNLLTVKECC